LKGRNMNAAQLKNSPRLRRILTTLLDGHWVTSWALSQLHHRCAISTDISELRANGVTIDCKRVEGYDGKLTVWAYQIPAAALSKAYVLMAKAEGDY